MQRKRVQIRNLAKLKEYRKDLRKNQTEAEKIVWRQLRGKQINHLKFFRQYSFGFYILDFYCPELNLQLS